MPEGDRVLCGDDDLGRKRLLDLGQQRPRRLAEHRSGVFQPEGPSQQRPGFQQSPGTRGEPAEIAAHHHAIPLGDSARHKADAAFGDVDGVLIQQTTEKLSQQERIPGCASGALNQVGVRDAAEYVGHHGDLGLLRERLQHRPHRARVHERLEHQPGRPAAAMAAAGQDPRQRVVRQQARQRAERMQGGRIGPVQIVEREQHQAGRRQFLQAHAQVAGLPSRPGHDGTPGRARHGAGHGRVQRRERGKPGQFVGIGGAEDEAVVACHLGGRGQQRRLATARLALHQQDAALASPGAVQQVEDQAPLDLTSPQPISSRLIFHATHSRGYTAQPVAHPACRAETRLPGFLQ